MTIKFAVLALLLLAAVAANGARAADKPVVVVETSLGSIEIELDDEKAPGTVKNFLAYVDDKHYDGTVFHRVMSDFMIQGGGFEPGMKQKKTKEAIENEAKNGLSNVRGAIAMARTSDPNSATCQFFINVVDNSKKLDPAATMDGVGYCVFGKVTKGMEVVDKIKEVKVGRAGGHQNVPVEDVVIKSVTRKKK